MNCGDDDLSPQYISAYQEGPYGPSLASSASSSSASVWSDAASQSSDDSSIHSSTASTESDISETFCCATQNAQQSVQHNSCDANVTTSICWPKGIDSGVAPAPQQRQNPRRSSGGTVARSGCPPSLVRQCDRKVNFVDSLVGKL